MSQAVSQNFANHARFDPWFHFFMIPVFLITWIISVVSTGAHPGLVTGMERGLHDRSAGRGFQNSALRT